LRKALPKQAFEKSLCQKPELRMLFKIMKKIKSFRKKFKKALEKK